MVNLSPGSAYSLPTTDSNGSVVRYITDEDFLRADLMFASPI